MRYMNLTQIKTMLVIRVQVSKIIKKEMENHNVK